MMFRALTAALAAITIATSAQAQTNFVPAPPPTPPQVRAMRLVPPAEFDHPYTNYDALQVIRVKTQKEVIDLCSPGNFTNAPFALACNYNFGGTRCKIIMVTDEVILSVGLPVDLIWRHELAHCNGWKGDHKGARSLNDVAREGR